MRRFHTPPFPPLVAECSLLGGVRPAPGLGERLVEMASTSLLRHDRATSLPCGGQACRFLAVAGVSLACIANMVMVLFMIRAKTDTSVGRPSAPPSSHRLAVVVPTHLGQYSRTLASLSRWPSQSCSAKSRHMELVLYFADNAEGANWSDEDLSLLTATAGTCFDQTSVIFANLSPEVCELRPKQPR